MKITKFLGAAIFMLSAASSFGEMIQGDGYSYFLSAPVGWVLDKSLAAEAESDVVLYPQGTTYQNAGSIITVNVVFKGDGYKDLQDLIQKDEADGRQQNPHFKVQRGPSLTGRFQKNLPLYIYSGLKDGGWEAAAYLEEKDRVLIFVLSSSSGPILHEDLPALQETAASYETLGDGRTLE